jgi:hypothetical protein
MDEFKGASRVDENGQPVPLEVVRTRVVNTNKICMAIISGDKVLEGPVDWAGSKFPFVMVYGEHIVLDGKAKWWGLVRHGKDAQRLHNLMLTNAAETAANSTGVEIKCIDFGANSKWVVTVCGFIEEI